jgi:CheY-like chemotaxis protein
MSRRAAWRRSSLEAFEIGKPDVDERPNLLLEPGLAGRGERLLVALARLGRVDALLQPVVAGDEELLNSLTRFRRRSHGAKLAGQISARGVMQALANLTEAIRVLIVDDHRLFAEALEAILVTDARIEIAGHASDGQEAIDLAAKTRPHVVLMDISMPVMNGFEATRRIKELVPDVRILMLTGSNSRIDVDEARRAGAAGYVTKDRIAAELVGAILEVVTG